MEYGCIGKKLSHSFSKIIHEKIGLYNYELFEIEESKLEAFLIKKDFRAINVTIPYKEKVIPYLDFISEEAKNIGAVNTVVNKNGKLFGYNTDFLGVKSLIQKNNIDVFNKKVVILGSGGTSKTAKAVFKHLGAKELLVVSRTARDNCISYEDCKEFHNDAQIIVNTTPVGMFPNIFEMPISAEEFKYVEAIVDVVYNPIKTSFVLNGIENEIKSVGGLYMLVAQAFYAAELFVDKKLDESIINEIFSELLSSKENIVLIGMPGCGKSTIGKILASELKKEFIDTDEEIVKKAKKTIPQIFEETGEEGFRELEMKVIKNISSKQNCVIATGGGAILHGINIHNLKMNGKVFFIDRDLEFLATTPDRPLSSNKVLLEKRFAERYDKYIAACDVHIKASQEIQDNITAIKRGFLNEDFSD